MKDLLGIFFGGAIGSVLRFFVGETVQNFFGKNFPWGILFVNVIGCFLMGILAILFIERFDVSQFWKMTIMVGFLGGFTTFSGFTIDVIDMFRQGLSLEAFFYIFLSVVLCLLATLSGILVAGK
jgi:CrcB protein